MPPYSTKHRNAKNTPLSLDSPLLHLSPHRADRFTLRDACAGVQVFGATGSGKSSAVNRAFVSSYLGHGFGALITTTKPGDTEDYIRYCEEAGRLDDLIVFGADSGHAFNFLRYESERPGRGAGQTENLVRLFTTVLEAADASASPSRANDQFWRKASQQLVRNAIDLLQFAGEPLTLPAIQDVLASAPESAEQVSDEGWRRSSLCWRYLQQAGKQLRDSEALFDFRATATFWTKQLPSQNPRTRGDVLQTFSVTAESLSRGLFRRLFCSGLNVVPEMCAAGKIWLIDLPVKVYGDVGRQAQCLIKYCFQQAMERRDLTKNPRPVALIVDEADLFLTSSDFSFQATARSSRVCSIYLTQSIAGLQSRLGQGGGNHNTQAFLANLTTKIFTANCEPSTYAYAEQLFGKHWSLRPNSSVSGPKNGGGTFRSGRDAEKPNLSSGVNPNLESYVQGSRLSQLRNGGLANRRQVEALIYSMSRTWAHTGTPVLPVIFTQAGS